MHTSTLLATAVVGLFSFCHLSAASVIPIGPHAYTSPIIIYSTYHPAALVKLISHEHDGGHKPAEGEDDGSYKPQPGEEGEYIADAHEKKEENKIDEELTANVEQTPILVDENNAEAGGGNVENKDAGAVASDGASLVQDAGAGSLSETNSGYGLQNSQAGGSSQGAGAGAAGQAGDSAHGPVGGCGGRGGHGGHGGHGGWKHGGSGGGGGGGGGGAGGSGVNGVSGGSGLVGEGPAGGLGGGGGGAGGAGAGAGPGIDTAGIYNLWQAPNIVVADSLPILVNVTPCIEESGADGSDAADGADGEDGPDGSKGGKGGKGGRGGKGAKCGNGGAAGAAGSAGAAPIPAPAPVWPENTITA